MNYAARTSVILFILVLLSVGAHAIDIPTERDEWQKMVFRYFQHVAKEMDSGNLSASLNDLFNEDELRGALGINNQFLMGERIVLVDSLYFLRSRGIELELKNISSCEEGPLCVSRHISGYQQADCSLASYSECPQGCNVTSKECIDNPCFGVTCADYCIDSVMYRHGRCNAGRCEYDTASCPDGCEGNSCKSPCTGANCPENCEVGFTFYENKCLDSSLTGILRVIAYYEDQITINERARIYLDGKLLTVNGTFQGSVPLGTHILSFADTNEGIWHTLVPYKYHDSIRYCNDWDIYSNYQCYSWNRISGPVSEQGTSGLRWLADMKIFPDAKAPDSREIVITDGSYNSIEGIYDSSLGLSAVDESGIRYPGMLPTIDGGLAVASSMQTSFISRWQDNDRWFFIRIKTDTRKPSLVNIPLCFGGTSINYREFLNLYLRPVHMGITSLYQTTHANMQQEYVNYYYTMDGCDEKMIVEESV